MVPKVYSLILVSILLGGVLAGSSFAAPTGSDGDLRKGIAWPNPRFSDNADGTVTDNLTGLIWLADASCLDTVGGVDKSSNYLTWANALTWSNNLANGKCGLTDSSSVGDWHLPNVQELQSLIAYQYDSPALSNDAGTGKWANDATSTFSGVVSGGYWSSSGHSSGTFNVWFVYLSNGFISYANISNNYSVWPVRD